MSTLDGCRVLLVEDESLVAMLAEDMLLDLGCEVTVTMRLDQALARAQEQAFDLAVLDVNLGDARSYPVADLLRARGVPFLFATGYGRQGVDPAYQAAPVMQKPYQASQLERLLTHLLDCGEPAPEDAAGARPPCRCLERGDGLPGFRADPLP
ncbi:sensory transduction regulatory protein [Methylobacterium tarhaniae]|uniref:Sensory transduction regulatory protein n=1 Tax=Methylobacterium tarhaniae TaxID=1187852 RepID=A0A0J6T4C0_9HYPH|nr:response regulator [Methylobacterium tarhaniae]KMO40617.1 sensory transduction regulatory protein [Methylobacterium tarhaniae]